MSAKKNKLTHISIQGIDIDLELNNFVFAPSQNGLFYANALTINPEDKVIDIGTGSGVLAIYAAKKGAIVSATDIEDAAVKLAKRNFASNNVKVDCQTGSLFGSFGGLFDVIIANLPNEIVPPSHSEHIGSQIADTFDGGKKGNECILALLNEANKYMHHSSRLYLPVHTLTDYNQVLQTVIKLYHAKLIALTELPAKPFVKNNLAFYLKLDRKGTITLVKKNNNWYSYGYVYELSLKP